MFFDMILTEENLLIIGVLFGLIMVSPILVDIITLSCKKDNTKDDSNDQH